MAIASPNAALSIHRLASRETANLPLTQVLVAKRNADLDHELTRQRMHPDADQQSVTVTGSEVEQALGAMERRWDQSLQVGRLLDKTA